MLVILDTNVLVAAVRSRRGASFQVLSLVGTDRFEIAVSVPLVLEYEAAMRRAVDEMRSGVDVGAILDYLCSVSRRQAIFYLWRPTLRDPADEMVLEVAVAAGAVSIVTFNTRDFVGSERFGVKVWSPQELLRRSGGRA